MKQFLKEKLYFLKKWYLHVFTYPQETIVVKNSQDYDTYWKEKLEERTMGLSSFERVRAGLVLEQLPDEAIVIGDIACGPGVILTHIVEEHKKAKGICYDISDYALKIAAENGMQTRKFDLGDSRSFDTLDKADYYLMLEILEHVPNSEEILQKTFDKSKRGVFVSFPNSGYFLYRLRLLFGKFPKQWIVFPNEHLRFWTIADAKWWLKAQGYTKYTIRPYKGIPLLKSVWPNLFAQGMMIHVKK